MPRRSTPSHRRIGAGEIGASCWPRSTPMASAASPRAAHSRSHREDAGGLRRQDFRRAARERRRSDPCWTGQTGLTAATIEVPRDPSSAAFPLVAALIVPGSRNYLPGILLNSRAHRLDRDASGDGRGYRRRQIAGLAAARTSAICACAHSRLKGVVVPASRAPSMIDEYPILAVAAAFAEGRTLMMGLEELRVKESDRLSAILRGLMPMGRRA